MKQRLQRIANLKRNYKWWSISWRNTLNQELIAYNKKRSIISSISIRLKSAQTNKSKERVSSIYTLGNIILLRCGLNTWKKLKLNLKIKGKERLLLVKYAMHAAHQRGAHWSTRFAQLASKYFTAVLTARRQTGREDTKHSAKILKRSLVSNERPYLVANESSKAVPTIF